MQFAMQLEWGRNSVKKYPYCVFGHSSYPQIDIYMQLIIYELLIKLTMHIKLDQHPINEYIYIYLYLFIYGIS